MRGNHFIAARHATGSFVSWPLLRYTVREARAEACGSWVTMMIVLPCSRLRAWSRSRISSPRLAVEVAGRLVAQEQRRVGDDGAGDADALLLAAGERARIMLARGGKAPPRPGPSPRVCGARPWRDASAAAAVRRCAPPSAPAADCRAGRRNPMCRARHAASSAVRQLVDPLAGDAHRPRGSGRSSPPIRLSSVLLPEPGRPHQRQEFARPAPPGADPAGRGSLPSRGERPFPRHPRSPVRHCFPVLGFGSWV